jgi:2'-5' RNA ligase
MKSFLSVVFRSSVFTFALSCVFLFSCKTRTFQQAEGSREFAAKGKCSAPPPAAKPAFLALSNLDLSKGVYSTSKLSHGSSGGYLAMAVPFAPVEEVFDALGKNVNVKLKNRGEAHITVVTPTEFQGALKGKISLTVANQIADQMNLQDSTFKVECLGSGKVTSSSKNLEAYFLVVSSPDLVDIRKQIAKKAGNPIGFDPEDYRPHITVGFTERDLHVEDCVYKDLSSCVADLNFK